MSRSMLYVGLTHHNSAVYLTASNSISIETLLITEPLRMIDSVADQTTQTKAKHIGYSRKWSAEIRPRSSDSKCAYISFALIGSDPFRAAQ